MSTGVLRVKRRQGVRVADGKSEHPPAELVRVDRLEHPADGLDADRLVAVDARRDAQYRSVSAPLDLVHVERQARGRLAIEQTGIVVRVRAAVADIRLSLIGFGLVRRWPPRRRRPARRSGRRRGGRVRSRQRRHLDGAALLGEPAARVQRTSRRDARGGRRIAGKHAPAPGSLRCPGRPPAGPTGAPGCTGAAGACRGPRRRRSPRSCPDTSTATR